MVTVSTQAQIALRSLNPQDRDQIAKWIELLDGLSQDEYVRMQVKPFSSEKDLYLMRVTLNLRLIFKSDGQDREIVDVVAHDRFERMHQYAH
jgi:mRNA-degrading endonuclease RelE of RelBE toxin-antitoxin system